MERTIEEFVEEISDNFSELLVEAFYIRYIREFPKKDMRRCVKLTKEEIIKKIAKRFNDKLTSINLPPV